MMSVTFQGNRTSERDWYSWIWQWMYDEGLSTFYRADDSRAWGKLSKVLGYLRKQQLAAPKGEKWPYLAAGIVVQNLRGHFQNPTPYSRRNGRNTFDRWANGNEYGSFNSDED